MAVELIRLSRHASVLGFLENGAIFDRKFCPGQVIYLGAVPENVFRLRQQKVRILRSVGQHQTGDEILISEHQAANWIERGVAEPVK